MEKDEKRDKVIISIKEGMVIDVDAPEDIDVVIRDYDTPRQGAYVDLKKYTIQTDEDGDEYVEEIW